MKNLLFTGILLFTIHSFSQNGKIMERKILDWKNNPAISNIVYNQGKLKPKYDYLNTVRIEKIIYESDGLKVVGYLVTPNSSGGYPCIVYNRG
jgi:dipeptidyl aminopeptidase/acylaminoacyl peptidase